MSTSASFIGTGFGNSAIATSDDSDASELAGLLEHSDGDTGGTAKEIRNALQSMAPEEREQQISKLSDQSLQQLSGTVEEGLSAGERTDVFNALAQALSPQQLTRVSSGLSNPANKDSLSDSVARFSPASVANSFKSQRDPNVATDGERPQGIAATAPVQTTGAFPDHSAGAKAVPGCDKEGTICVAQIPKDAKEVKNPWRTISNTQDDDKAMHEHKGDVQVVQGSQEKIGFIETDGSFRNPSDAQSGHTDTQDNARASARANDKMVIHGHTPKDDGVVDDTEGGTKLGDSQPLITGRTNGTVTPDGRVGVHELVNGRLQFRMIDGKMTPSEQEKIERNLSAEQKLWDK